MPRVLIVAYYFPPIGGIGSIRLARFASFLPDFGWEPTVLAPRDTPHAADDRLDFPEERVVRSRSLEPSRLRRAAAGTRAPESRSAGVRPVVSALRAAALRYAFFPDAQVGWLPGALRSGLRVLREERFDAIYSSSNPMTAHLVARALARRSGVPWVAEYRDPWADHSYRAHPYRRVADALERAVARDATTVVMPTPTWAKHYGERWGVDVEVIPNGCDADLPERRPPAQPTLTHVGTYYPGDHDMRALWEALAARRARGTATLPRLRFVGTLPDELRAEIGSFGLADLIESTGFVSHDEAMTEMMSASMLMASGIAGADPIRRGWVPAKIFEYLASGLPILYLADSKSDAAHLLVDQPGCHVVAPDDVTGVERALEIGLREGDADRRLEGITREAGARSLAGVLDRARKAPA